MKTGIKIFRNLKVILSIFPSYEYRSKLFQHQARRWYEVVFALYAVVSARIYVNTWKVTAAKVFK